MVVWLNARVFVYKLSGSGFESRCCHIKKTTFNNIINIEIKTATTAVINNGLKYLPMSEGNNNCRIEPKLETLSLIQFSKGLV